MGNEDLGKVVVKKSYRHLYIIGVNFILALISIYLFEFWFKQIVALEDTIKMISNIAIVALTGVTFFVAKTFYIKGVMNTVKKILILTLLVVSILGLVLLSSPNPQDIIYPLSGIFIVGIAFYMLSLTTGTLKSEGIIWITILTGSSILLGWFYHWLSTDDILFLSKLSVFLILFIGGTWAELRAYIHGIRGVNKDEGGFGDSSDGNGDTGEE